ncbi:MAG: HAD-IG family 5'-nucleotidase [Spirochaetia bacterium]|nr:HAD-IG family 5'-nucleotidase [Spirochaetia bacterium]
MPIFVNRSLNLKKIKLIGFDMDYTLVPYETEAFEELTYTLAKERLIEVLSYPKELNQYSFDFNRAIVGLVIDKRNGYLLQLSRYNKVKISYYGLERVPYREQNRVYQNMAIELRDPDFQSLDTAFAISYGVLFSQAVELKKQGYSLPSYQEMEKDIHDAIDMVHRDGSLKSEIKKNFKKYVILDPRTAQVLERYKDYGKKLMIITNSDFSYTQALLNYAIDPFLKKHKSWKDVFDIVITFADKPKFFEHPARFLKIDPTTGLMSNHEGSVTSGIYQGGNSKKLQHDMQLQGSEILYIGDHIYGDVVSIKKLCNWRTALVLGDLEREMDGIRRSQNVQQEIDRLMHEKDILERELNQIDIKKYEGKRVKHHVIDELFQKIDGLNTRISSLLDDYMQFFNPYWGEILRAGAEESRYAEQIEKYACIYMTRVSDLYEYSPRTYFRPIKRIMPHELAVMGKNS